MSKEKGRAPDATTTDQLVDEDGPIEGSEFVAEFAQKMQEGPDKCALDRLTNKGRFLKVSHPDFLFIAKAWPFGFVHDETGVLFNRALVADIKGRGENFTQAPSIIINALPSRFRFYVHQQEQVQAAFSVTMTAVLALHLATSGKILQKTFNMVFHRHKVSAQLILKTHPSIRSWMDTKDNIPEQISKLLKHQRHLFLNQNYLHVTFHLKFCSVTISRKR